MPDIIGVQFRPAGKIYFFSPNGHGPQVDDHVIVETSRGIEYATVRQAVHTVSEKEVHSPLKPIVRMATPQDDHTHEENLRSAEHALAICKEKIIEHKLDMHLLDAEYTFDNNKILFYFTAEGRVDFRELVKDLASVFHTRIELRQIGVRDEAKIVGGIGICGRPLCCHRFLGEFSPVSIKMAKEQNLSLNPTKISGCCGRLLCCLKYENDHYEESNRERKAEQKAMEKKNAHKESFDGETLDDTTSLGQEESIKKERPAKRPSQRSQAHDKKAFSKPHSQPLLDKEEKSHQSHAPGKKPRKKSNAPANRRHKPKAPRKTPSKANHGHADQ